MRVKNSRGADGGECGYWRFGGSDFDFVMLPSARS